MALNHFPSAGKHKVDPSLPPRGSIALGYGSGGGAPFVFTFHENLDVGVGFLKLFLSTEYVDLSHLEQTSPLKGTTRGIKQADLKPIPMWDTIIVPVVHRKFKG